MPNDRKRKKKNCRVARNILYAHRRCLRVLSFLNVTLSRSSLLTRCFFPALNFAVTSFHSSNSRIQRFIRNLYFQEPHLHAGKQVCDRACYLPAKGSILRFHLPGGIRGNYFAGLICFRTNYERLSVSKLIIVTRKASLDQRVFIDLMLRMPIKHSHILDRPIYEPPL